MLDNSKGKYRNLLSSFLYFLTFFSLVFFSSVSVSPVSALEIHKNPNEGVIIFNDTINATYWKNITNILYYNGSVNISENLDVTNITAGNVTVEDNLYTSYLFINSLIPTLTGFGSPLAYIKGNSIISSGWTAHRNSNDRWGAYNTFLKSRGTSQASVGDYAGGLLFYWLNNAGSYKTSSAIWGRAKSITSGSESSDILFFTSQDGDVNPDDERMAILADGNVTINQSLRVGHNLTMNNLTIDYNRTHINFDGGGKIICIGNCSSS